MKTPIAWLENELPLWIKDALITKDNADILLDRYKSKTTSASNTISVALIIFGALLIGLGVIFLFAYNWEVLARPFKAAIAVVLLLLAQGFGLYARRYKSKSLGLNECASLFLFLAFICSLAIISQTYNMGGDVLDFIRVVAIFGVPIIYLFNSRSVAFLLFIAIASIICLSKFQSYAVELSDIGWLLLAAWLPWYALHLKNSRRENSAVFINLAFFIGTLFIFFSVSFGAMDMFMDAWLLLSSFWMFGVLLYGEEERSFRRIFELFSKIGISSLLIALCAGIPSSFGQDIDGLFYGNYISLMLFFVLFALLCVFRRGRFYELLFPLSPLIFYITVVITRGDDDLFVPLANLFVIIGALAMVVGGARKADTMLANQGLIFISILIAIYFFKSDLSLLFKGAGFIFVGVLFMCANIALRRYLKDKR
ncbi:MAG: DUF2157 domain-containing protein [Campylobacteraceae bacterium]|jgi:uncharacterized membrane protein|nr:DUF2157 domain-containing protein [Campylobacteraceae bacterium]